MAFTNDFDTPDSPPPPAYELTDQEYDQKTSHVLETSQSEPQYYPGDGEEEWEVWDESIFAANASGHTSPNNQHQQQAGSSSRSPIDASASSASTKGVSINYSSASSSSLSSVGQPSGSSAVQPLRIVKKNNSSPPSKQKERPNWYAEAQLDQHEPSQASTQQSQVSLSRQPTYLHREPTPPPMFTAIGDQPPYEPPPIVMTYQPGDSRPASPLESPPQAYLPYPPSSTSFNEPSSPTESVRRLPRPPPVQSAPAVPTVNSLAPPPPPMRTQHQSMLPPSRPSPRASPRPTTSYQPRPPPMSSFGPRVAFDPRVAYANLDRKSGEEPPVPTKVDASAFYRLVFSEYQVYFAGLNHIFI